MCEQLKLSNNHILFIIRKRRTRTGIDTPIPPPLQLQTSLNTLNTLTIGQYYGDYCPEQLFERGPQTRCDHLLNRVGPQVWEGRGSHLPLFQTPPTQPPRVKRPPETTSIFLSALPDLYIRITILNRPLLLISTSARRFFAPAFSISWGLDTTPPTYMPDNNKVFIFNS